MINYCHLILLAKNIVANNWRNIGNKASIIDMRLPQNWNRQMWNQAYDYAAAQGNKAEMQRLRDLHFSLKSENNENRVFAHTTPYKFTFFDKSKFGLTDEGFNGKGFYFSTTRIPEDPSVHKIPLGPHGEVPTMNYGKNKMYVYLKGNKEFDVGNPDRNFFEEPNTIGIVTDEAYYQKGHPTEVITGNPNHIKLADAEAFDDFGNRIPLADRDNFSTPDFRGEVHNTYNHPEQFMYPAEAIPEVGRSTRSSKSYVSPNIERVELVPEELMSGASKEKTTTRNFPISYGYDRKAVAAKAKEEFTDEIRRPLIIRAANEDNILADALDKTINGTSETRFGTGVRTMTEPGPHEVVTGTYYDLKTGQPVVRGSGLIGTGPVPVTATEGAYKSSGNFGNMISVTDSMLGGGKYGFRNWEELEDYVLNLDLDTQQFNYIADLINRTRSFESGLELGPKTTNGLIPKPLRKKEEQFLQYLVDQRELGDWLMGNMTMGAKNQRVVYPAPKEQQIIIGKNENSGFIGRKANIGMELNDFTGKPLLYHQVRGVPKELWPNGMQAEEQISRYNTNPEFQRTILSSKYNPKVIFPLHFQEIGPNPFPGMTTMQVKGVKSTFKKGGKIKVSAK